MMAEPGRVSETWRWYDAGVRNSVLRIGGLSVLLVYAFFYLTVPKIGGQAQTILAIAGLLVLLLSREAGPARTPLLLLGLAILVQVLSWYVSLDLFPGYSEEHPKIDRLARWFLFVLITPWLIGRTNNVLVLWAACLAGFLLAPWITGAGWQEWRAGLSGARVDFGLLNAQHTAMVFGFGLLGMIAFFGRIVLRHGFSAQRFVLWVIPFGTCLAGVIVTQTRGVWIAVSVGVLAMLVTALMLRRKGKGRAWSGRTVALGALAVLVIGGMQLVLFADHIGKRMDKERETIEHVLSGDLDQIPYNSTGVRIHTWVAAGHWIAQYPWLGLGKQGSVIAIQQSEQLPDRIKRRFGHLHNTYLDLLAQHGIAGLAVLMALIGWLISAAVQAWRTGHMPVDVLLFYAAFLPYWLVVNTFESFMFYSSGRFIFNLAAAGVLVHYAMSFRARVGKVRLDDA